MKNFLYWCWVVALLGCGASLYYGEILMIEPCRMCWYQRMALFPLALILGIAAYRNDRSAVRYAIPLAVFGFAAAAVQAVGIHFPSFQLCGKECAKPIFTLLGLTFPDLSALGFAAIGIILSFYSDKK